MSEDVNKIIRAYVGNKHWVILHDNTIVQLVVHSVVYDKESREVLVTLEKSPVPQVHLSDCFDTYDEAVCEIQRRFDLTIKTFKESRKIEGVSHCWVLVGFSHEATRMKQKKVK